MENSTLVATSIDASVLSSSAAAGISSAPQATDDNIFQSSAFKTLCSVFFSIIIIKGITGNTLVLVSLFRYPDIRTPYNFLIGNIAFADLGVCAISAPMRIIELYIGWPFGAVISCKILAPLQDVFVCVSIVTHTAIALERFRAIITPFKRQISKRKVKQIVILSWTMCYLAVAVAQVIFLEYRQGNDALYYCVFGQFPAIYSFRRVYSMYLVAVFILAPLIVQGVCYGKIVLKLRATERNLRQSQAIPLGSPETKQRRLNGRRREHLIRVLCILTGVFHVCYLPRGIMMVIEEFTPPEASPKQSIAFAHLTTLAVYYTKHVINPVILCLLAKEFRRCFKTTCSCFLSSAQ